MKRVLAISYSQSGQSARALDTFLEGFAPAEELEIERVDLGSEPAVQEHYKMPWNFFDFLRAQPEAFKPKMAIEACSRVHVGAFDTLVISYPVWFLSPATPVSAFLVGLPGGSLQDKEVITISTCRNMWLEAQLMIRALVERLGGRVVAHITLEDTAPTYATLVTTPRFFLSGKKGFSSKVMQRLFPPFGVAESEYLALKDWAGQFKVDQAAPKSRFRFKTSLALAEVVGRRISLGIYRAWPLVRGRSSFLQGIYLALAGACTFALIMLLMPPTVLVGKLPPLRRALERLPGRLVSELGGGLETDRSRS